MVPSLSEDIAYSSRQESESIVSPSAHKNLEHTSMPEFDGVTMMDSTHGISSTSLLSPHSDSALQGVEAQPLQEWPPPMLEGNSVMSNELIQQQDLFWMEGPDLVFFPGSYHGQIDPYARIFNS